MPLSKQRFARPPTPPDTDTTLRRSERFYKRKDIPLDLSDAFDWQRDDSGATKIGERCYTFPRHPGEFDSLRRFAHKSATLTPTKD